MSLSQIVRVECPTCKKIAVEKSRAKIGKVTMITLACGHLMTIKSLESDISEFNKLVFNDGCKPRNYQIEAMQFAERANFNCIIADEQGLGKTIESACPLKMHPDILLPAIIVVPTTVKRQWMHEINRICCGELGFKNPQFLTQVIQNGKEKALPGFKIYIVTFDMLKKDDIFEYIPDGSLQTLIIDECQRIKNHLSDRAKAVQRMAKKVKHIIPMSGTPIKNNAGEYFTVLNLVAPTRFPNYQNFLNNYCDTYDGGWGTKVGGLKNADRFHEDTKDIIIRRTKAEVLKDLPSLDRKFYHVEFDKKLNKAYESGLKELEELLYSDEGGGFGAGAAKIAIMSKLRHLTGISKTEECIDFATEFLLSCDRKLVIFTHHLDVAEIILARLRVWCTDGGYGEPLSMNSSLDGNGRANLVARFKDSNSRIMIASTQASGEGLNLQFCSDAVILERQWNPANEEQAEARFHRFGQLNNVSITYMIASGTIDEYFTELVEVKRSIVASTMDNKEIPWDSNSLMKELAEVLVTKGRDKWRM